MLILNNLFRIGRFFIHFDETVLSIQNIICQVRVLRKSWTDILQNNLRTSLSFSFRWIKLKENLKADSIFKSLEDSQGSKLFLRKGLYLRIFIKLSTLPCIIVFGTSSCRQTFVYKQPGAKWVSTSKLE